MSLHPELVHRGKACTIPRTWLGARVDPPQVGGLCSALVSVPPPVMGRHVFCLGGTGTGKTVSVIHFGAQDIELDHGLVVLDMRGDLVQTFLALCQGRVSEDRIRLIDLRAGHPSHGFNPLSGAGEQYFRALGFLNAIEQASESWGIQLSESLRMAILLLTEAGKFVTDLEAVFYDQAFRLTCLASCNSEHVRNFWQRYDDLSAERQSGFASPVLNKVSLLWSTPKLASVLSHPNPIDLGKHINTPGSITLVSMAVDELHGSARMMAGLFLRCLCREIFARVDTPESKRVPIRLYADEFSNFSGDDFESILAEGRRFRFSLLLALQTLSQFSPKMRAMVLNNVGVKLVFACGREDSAAMAKDLTGDSKAFNLCSLPTGHCVLWQRGEEPFEIEVNEPLIPNLEPHMAAIEAFARSVVGEEPRSQPEPLVTRPAVFDAEDGDGGRNGALEDWLCD